MEELTSRAVFVSGALAAAPGRLDFFGLQQKRSELANIDPLIDRVVDQAGRLEPSIGLAAPGVTGGAAGFLSNLKLLRVDTFPRFVKEYVEQVRATRSLGLPGLHAPLIEQFLPEAFESRRDLPFFKRIGYFFKTDRLLDTISEAESGFLKALFQLIRLDWDGIDSWGIQDNNLQQLNIYFLELFHGRFRDRNGTLLSFGEDAGVFRHDRIEVSPAVAGKLFYVLVEFIGDKLFNVPVAATKQQDPPAFTSVKAGLITKTISNVLLNGTGDVDYSELVSAVVRYAAGRAEKTTRASVGALVRGGGIASINNEVVAEIIATTASNLAKKATERLTHGILTGYITDPNIGGTVQQKQRVLSLLNFLHLDVKLPEGITF